MAVLDHISDSNHSEFYRLSRLYDFPAFVKQASSEALYPETLHGASCGDETQKMYPCNTPASTWLSCLYFHEKGAEAGYTPAARDRVRARLDGFVKYWGIKAAADQIAARHAQLYKNADENLPDSAFGYVWKGSDGTRTRYLRMTGSGEVKAAAEYLQKYVDAIPYADRHVVANRILEKAASFGAGLGDKLDRFLERQAGMGICDVGEAVRMIRQRSTLAKSADDRQQIDKLADMVDQRRNVSLQPDMLVKLATHMDAIDRGLGLVGGYGDILRRPEDVLFKITYKEARASVDEAVRLTTGRTYSRGEFHKIALADVQAIFGSDVASDVSTGLGVDPDKLAAFAETAPRDDAEMFEQLLKDAQINPIHAKAAAERFGFKADELEALAAGY